MPFLNSYFIDKDAARKAVELSLPMIHAAMADHEAGDGNFLYIVIMKPGSSPACTGAEFEDAILYEHAVGDEATWDADYRAFARAKAKLAWRTGVDAQTVQEFQPQLLAACDTVLGGSCVLNGIVVGVSGADPWYDEAFAGIIAMCLRAIAKKGFAAEREKSLFLRQK